MLFLSKNMAYHYAISIVYGAARTHCTISVRRARACQQPGEFVHTTGDTHVYLNHVEPLKEQLQREPRPFPRLRIARALDNIEHFTMDDFVLEGYEPHKRIHMEMAV